MKENIFLPDIIKVGFQKRDDTFTGQLAYVTYYDNKGVLRKEKSWNNWKDSKIPQQEFKNIPMSGFVLNKKVGGYKSDWNYRQSYLRVYDPRGFEFEITLENLLFILENVECLMGKGLNGDFIYGWDGTELVLLPTKSEMYKNIKEFNEKIIYGKTVKDKDLIKGFTYKNKKNEELIYMGQFDTINPYYKELMGKEHFFIYKNKSIITYRSINNANFVLIDDIKVENFDKLIYIIKEYKYYFNNETMNIKDITLDEFKNLIKTECRITNLYMGNLKNNIKPKKLYIYYHSISKTYYIGNICYKKDEMTDNLLKSIYEEYKPFLVEINN